MEDGFGRRFGYVRLSITDQCNFRCQYCLPNGYRKSSGPAFLTREEIVRLARGLVGLGVWKIRLTGGEPTVRHDFAAIIGDLSRIGAIRKIATTTNGYNLHPHAALWRAAGLTDLNVSVDSLQPEKFRAITGHDKLNQILAGIKTARHLGFHAVKVNCVLLRGVNDDEFDAYLAWARREAISLRFIELMQTGDNADYFARHHYRADVLRAKLEGEGWVLQPREDGAGPAAIYKHAHYQGSIGLIAPYSKDFCANCNRLRVTARGDLRLCLFGEYSHPLRDLLQSDDQIEALQDRICALLHIKKPTHALHDGMTGLTPHLASLGG